MERCDEVKYLVYQIELKLDESRPSDTISADSNMRRRPLGKTVLDVSGIGFGAWTSGCLKYGEVKREDAFSTRHAYLQAGGNFIDMARTYLAGEKLAGQAISLHSPGEDVIPASKTRRVEPGVNIVELDETFSQPRNSFESGFLLTGK